MTRIVVVDDHPVFRKGLIALLRAAGLDVVGEATNGLEALQVTLQADADVVLMDISMPELGGIEATERILARLPSVRVVVITLHEDEETVAAALRAGASAYVTKQTEPDQILAAVRAAESGALWLGADVPRPIGGASGSPGSGPATLPGLTPRETAIADLVAKGLTNPMIAERLHLSAKTVANYVSIAALKVGADDRAELARIVRAARGR